MNLCTKHPDPATCVCGGRQGCVGNAAWAGGAVCHRQWGAQWGGGLPVGGRHCPPPPHVSPSSQAGIAHCPTHQNGHLFTVSASLQVNSIMQQSGHWERRGAGSAPGYKNNLALEQPMGWNVCQNRLGTNNQITQGMCGKPLALQNAG